ncbi:MAG: [protein-PII] uridylyltransferase [Moraxella sp.]|nr:[protein-PII] uridylyltransferase [Moraxella sp.]
MLYYKTSLLTHLSDIHFSIYHDFIKEYSAPRCLLSSLSSKEFLEDKDTHLSELKIWINGLNTYIHDIIHKNTPDDLCQEHSLLPTLLRFRAGVIDSILVTLFSHLELTTAALFALGGYGRAELFSHSDVDLLILHENSDPLDTLKTFVTLLWDIGISPAARIHHIDDKECVAEITIATSLLENRFLAGNTDFIHTPSQWLKQQYTPTTFFTAKYEEYKARHKKNDYNEYVLEPNIKEGVGGLRDIHFLHWIAKFYFNLAPDITLRQLVKSRFLTDQECQELIHAKHYLWLIRHYLHHNEQKDNNKLSFGQQKTIAHQLGLENKDDNPNYAPEMLMKRYYRSAMTIATLGHYLGELFFNEFLEKETKTSLNKHYYLSQNYFGEQLGIFDNNLFTKHPDEILKIFLTMGEQDIKSLTANTLRALRNASTSIDDKFLNNEQHKQLFLKNLDEPNYLFHRLRLMKRTGILGAYLPAFSAITGLMQYDLFHRYTVDAHTLFLVRMLHRFGNPTYADSFGVVSTVYKELPDKLPLVVAALFHDIAKGQGGDHSELGAVLAKGFCAEHGLGKADSKLVVWLVENHLVMSLTAQKKDIYNPKIISDFARFVGDIRHLDYLYLLTVADMNATNSQLWNNWRATLLKKLYLATHHVLSLGIAKLAPENLIKDTQLKARQRLARLGVDITAAERLWQALPPEHFLKHNASDITWHTKAILSHDKDAPLVALRPHKEKSLFASQLFIHTQNAPNLFATTVILLDKFGYSIYDASILTDDNNHALDSYVITRTALSRHSIFSESTPIKGDSPDPKALIDALGAHLKNPSAFLAQYRPDRHQKREAGSLTLRHFTIVTDITFERTEAGFDNLHIITKDRSSLLAKIGWVFATFGLWVHSAKITTLGERAEDVFCVSDGGKPLSDMKKSALKTTLLEAFDDG